MESTHFIILKSVVALGPVFFCLCVCLCVGYIHGNEDLTSLTYTARLTTRFWHLFVYIVSIISSSEDK